jgi:hypothetical protein
MSNIQDAIDMVENLKVALAKAEEELFYQKRQAKRDAELEACGDDENARDALLDSYNEPADDDSIDDLPDGMVYQLLKSGALDTQHRRDSWEFPQQW